MLKLTLKGSETEEIFLEYGFPTVFRNGNEVSVLMADGRFYFIDGTAEEVCDKMAAERQVALRGVRGRPPKVESDGRNND